MLLLFFSHAVAAAAAAAAGICTFREQYVGNIDIVERRANVVGGIYIVFGKRQGIGFSGGEAGLEGGGGGIEGRDGVERGEQDWYGTRDCAGEKQKEGWKE